MARAVGIAALVLGLTSAAAPALAWQQTLADSALAGMDRRLAVVSDADRNVIVAGSEANPAGGSDFLVVKLAAATGAELWRRTFDGTATSSADAAFAVAVDASGDVVAAGKTTNTGTGSDLTVVKLAGADGTPRWAQPAVIDGVAHGTDEATAVAVDAAGDVLVAGFTQSSATASAFTVAKLAGATGAPLWPAPFLLMGSASSGPLANLANALALDAAGNPVAAGFVSNTSFGLDIAVVKLASVDGTPFWSQTALRGTGNDVDLANAVAVDPAGDVVVAGITSNTGTGPDFAVLKLAGATGAPVWPAFVHIAGTEIDTDDDEARAIGVDGAGNVLAAGAVGRRTGDVDASDFVVVKLAAADGTELWRHVVAGSVTEGASNGAWAVAVDAGGNVVAAGGVESTGAGSDAVVVRLAAADGTELVRATAAGAGTASDDARAAAADAAGNVLAAGRAGGDIVAFDVGCTGGDPHPCAATGPCYDTAACDVDADFCAGGPKPDGTPCSDGNACTQTDACQAGTCVAAPLEAAGCALQAAAAAPECAGLKLPRGVRRGLARARAAIAKAEKATDPAKRARLVARAGTRIAKLSVAIDRAAARKRHPLAATCAAALHALVAEAQAHLA